MEHQDQEDFQVGSTINYRNNDVCCMIFFKSKQYQMNSFHEITFYLGPVGPRGLPGPRGEKGNPGPMGKYNNIINNTTKLL